MRFQDKITVELNALDAAIASVLLAENAGREALKALLADKPSEIGGTTNRGPHTLADSYIKVGSALTLAILGEKGNQGLQSTETFASSIALMADTMRASVAVTEVSKDES